MPLTLLPRPRPAARHRRGAPPPPATTAAPARTDITDVLWPVRPAPARGLADEVLDVVGATVVLSPIPTPVRRQPCRHCQGGGCAA